MTVVPEPDRALLDRILAGEERALEDLVAREHAPLCRVVRTLVRDSSLIEDIVQDSWVSILRALPTFEGRSSLRTWMTRIALNRAKTTMVRLGRTVPLSALADEAGEAEAVVDRSRFNSIGFWTDVPSAWGGRSPDELLADVRLRSFIEAEIAELPEGQRAVVTFRDLEGWDSADVCNALEISESNQRVLLHRARSRLRAALERYLREPGPLH
ncbi:MAG: sigma-70 family RNA polymerase sigma factor [Myxococcales bacterium]|nr:sigma-70 family RNA polymerase sigma factor [Myxococcales bacterium]